jgi:hypothetical protein
MNLKQWKAYVSFRNIALLIIVLSLQIVISLFVFHPFIIKWGATQFEIKMPIPGDHFTEAISSTRAININQPANVVWNLLIDLGSDRKGFYSFILLESLYVNGLPRNNTYSREFNLGRFIPASLPDSKGKYNFGFKVIEIEPGYSFVLKGWGGFLIEKVDKNNSRLIIRTHSSINRNIINWLSNSIFDLLHFIMEKRMMLGIKDIAETKGENYTNISDTIYLLSIVISGLTAIFMVFNCKGMNKLITPSILLLIWQFTFLVLDPRALYSILLVILFFVVMVIKSGRLTNFLKNSRIINQKISKAQ